MRAEALTTPKTEVLRFIVQNSIWIQDIEGSREIPLVRLALRMCDDWNEQVADNLLQRFPRIRVILITDGDAKGSHYNNPGHTIGIGSYEGEMFAYDASIAQQRGIHERRPVRIWQGSSDSLQSQLVETFGGSWKGIKTALGFLKGEVSYPEYIRIPHFHNPRED